ncbi:MAG: ATP-grasp domain-containing protein, partial [Candidatus Gracilibacteria bacterium]|nr:ATP-grasp domain-containing protein [Candidatus Gracilibacteria bacterium]
DKEKQCFTQYIDLDKNGNVIYINEDIKPDIIWFRYSSGIVFNSELFSNFTQVPSLKIISIAKNKYDMYLFLKDFTPKSYLLEDFFKKDVFESFQEKLVLKPIDGNSGKGIEFLSKNELLEKKESLIGLEKLFIVQEFKDFSKGYDEKISGIHDVRLVFVGGKFSFSVVRNPASGSLKSNIGSGGSQFSLSKEEIPSELFETAKKALERLGVGSKDIISVDFAYCQDESKWYILEINFSPGIYFPEKDLKFQNKYFNDLANFFNSIK